MKKLIIRISESLHRKFKAACAEKGLSMNTVVTKLIEEWLKNNAKI